MSVSRFWGWKYIFVLIGLANSPIGKWRHRVVGFSSNVNLPSIYFWGPVMKLIIHYAFRGRGLVSSLLTLSVLARLPFCGNKFLRMRRNSRKLVPAKYSKNGFFAKFSKISSREIFGNTIRENMSPQKFVPAKQVRKLRLLTYCRLIYSMLNNWTFNLKIELLTKKTCIHYVHHIAFIITKVDVVIQSYPTFTFNPMKED